MKQTAPEQTGLAAVLAGVRRAYTRTLIVSTAKAVTWLKPSLPKGLLAQGVCVCSLSSGKQALCPQRGRLREAVSRNIDADGDSGWNAAADSGFASAAPMRQVLVRTLTTQMRLAHLSEVTRAATM